MSNEDLIPTFQGTWFNQLDPFWGYLKIGEYKSISDGGEAVAIVHARHGKNEPAIWYRGVWKPTDQGFEVLAGPYHWKNICLFSTPPTKESPNRLMFRSKLNGWGNCNLGRLSDEEEQKFVDSLSDLPIWQDVKSFWRDYPSATWEESKKYMQPFVHVNGPPSSQPQRTQFPENFWTHNGGQPLPSQGGGEQPEGAQQHSNPPANSDGGQPNQQPNTPQDTTDKPKQEAKAKASGGRDKDGDGHVIDDVVTGRAFKKDDSEK